MSKDSRLKDINTLAIMKDERPEDLIPRARKLIHEQDLETQQKDLFWAFFKGDENYVYEFDKETLSRRQTFI